jgi:hypothetical protein
MRDRKELHSKIAYGSFYLAVIIEVFVVIIDKSSYTNPIEGRLFQLTFVLCLLKVCLTKYDRKEYATIFLFCVLGAISYLVTGRNEIIRLVMLVAACKDVEMQKCLKLVFWLTLAGCCGIMLLSIAGIYGAVSLTQDYGRGYIETRYTLGLGHPNALHCMVWALTTLGLYLYAEKMKWIQYLVVILINAAAFILSDSRTSVLVAAFTIGMSYLSVPTRREWVKKMSAWCNLLATAGSIAVSVIIAANAFRVYSYDWEWNGDPSTIFFVKLNRLLNGRIRILTETDGWEGSISSWSLFSKPDTEYYFDMGWIRLFYWYGIIPAGVFIAVLFAVIIYCYHKKQYMAITLIAAFSVYSIIEAHAVSVYLARNYIFFLVGGYWYKMIEEIQNIRSVKKRKV